jgi:hypothetical protein
MYRIKFLEPLPHESAITKRAIANRLSIAQRTDKTAEHKEKSDTTVTTSIERTNVIIGKV